MVPEFFCKEDDWSIYYKLIEEMKACQESREKDSDWISWHEGAHLIVKNPAGSPTFQKIQDRLSDYFGITRCPLGPLKTPPLLLSVSCA